MYNNTVRVSIKDTPELRELLKANGSSYSELNQMVGQINLYFNKNKSEVKTSLVNLYTTNKKKKKNRSGTCSKALQFIGYVHSGAYAAAAAMLGVTGPTAVIVPLLIGLIYQAGSLFC